MGFSVLFMVIIHLYFFAKFLTLFMYYVNWMDLMCFSMVLKGTFNRRHFAQGFSLLLLLFFEHFIIFFNFPFFLLNKISKNTQKTIINLANLDYWYIKRVPIFFSTIPQFYSLFVSLTFYGRYIILLFWSFLGLFLTFALFFL